MAGRRKLKGYLHGYSSKEQLRLYHQARFYEKFVYEKVDFSKISKVLEVGCGVGAQTEILLERFPHLQIQGVDLSPIQIQQAKRHLAPFVESGQVKFDVENAERLPYKNASFDGAFLCWFLEHVHDPVKILKEVRRVLKKHGVIYISEVFNATFFVHPYSPNILRYWFAYNDHQWTLGGDPFMGAKLGNSLLEAGYQKVTTEVVTQHLDNRVPHRRAEFIEEWTRMLLSGAPGLLKAKKVTPAVVAGMKKELNALKRHADSVFFMTFVRARAQA